MDDITSPRPFENDEEVSTLSTLLKSQLNLHNVSCPFQAEADATDVTNYILELVEDNETVGQIINEVRDLGFTEICTEETLEALRVKLAEFLVGMEGRGWKNKWEAAVRKDTEQQQQNNSSVSAATITPPMTPPKKEVKEKEISSFSPTSSPSRPTLQKQNTQDSDYYKEIQARLSAKNTTVETIGSQSAGRKLTYAEEIQAREKARGESVVKNSAAMQASGSGRGGVRNDTVEANGRGYSGISSSKNTKRQMSYAEEIQAREKARGEEIVKNSAAMQASGTARGNIRNDTIESNGKGALYQTSGKRQMSYAEEIQARERARGEAIVKNSAKAQSGARRASLHSYTSSASGASAEGEGSGGNNNHEERGHSPDSVNADLSGRSVDVDVKQDLDQMRREELMIVMKDRSLSREEKAMKMKEIREKYA
jgi:hypothetical protein